MKLHIRLLFGHEVLIEFCSYRPVEAGTLWTTAPFDAGESHDVLAAALNAPQMLRIEVEVLSAVAFEVAPA